MLLGGALTTFCAAVPLLFTQIIFFKEMVRPVGFGFGFGFGLG